MRPADITESCFSPHLIHVNIDTLLLEMFYNPGHPPAPGATLLQQQLVNIFIIRIETIREQMNFFLTPSNRHLNTRQKFYFVAEFGFSRLVVAFNCVVVGNRYGLQPFFDGFLQYLFWRTITIGGICMYVKVGFAQNYGFRIES